MNSGIYKIEHITSGKHYIGSAINIQHRWYEHRSLLRRGQHHNAKLQNAWAKYGETCFRFSVIENVGAPTQLIAREQVWIDGLMAFSRGGYNLSPTAGSVFGMRHSKETRARMSAAHRGRTPTLGRKTSPETRAKLSALMRGNTHLVGHTHSPETRAKLSIALLGNQRALGYKHSLETRAKVSAAGRGRTPILGKKLSLEVRTKMSAAHIGKRPSAETIAKRIATRARNKAVRLEQRQGEML